MLSKVKIQCFSNHLGKTCAYLLELETHTAQGNNMLMPLESLWEVALCSDISFSGQGTRHIIHTPKANLLNPEPDSIIRFVLESGNLGKAHGSRSWKPKCISLVSVQNRELVKAVYL